MSWRPDIEEAKRRILANVQVLRKSFEIELKKELEKMYPDMDFKDIKINWEDPPYALPYSQLKREFGTPKKERFVNKLRYKLWIRYLKRSLCKGFGLKKKELFK